MEFLIAIFVGFVVGVIIYIVKEYKKSNSSHNRLKDTSNTGLQNPEVLCLSTKQAKDRLKKYKEQFEIKSDTFEDMAKELLEKYVEEEIALYVLTMQIMSTNPNVNYNEAMNESKLKLELIKTHLALQYVNKVTKIVEEFFLNEDIVNIVTNFIVQTEPTLYLELYAYEVLHIGCGGDSLENAMKELFVLPNCLYTLLSAYNFKSVSEQEQNLINRMFALKLSMLYTSLKLSTELDGKDYSEIPLTTVENLKKLNMIVEALKADKVIETTLEYESAFYIFVNELYVHGLQTHWNTYKEEMNLIGQSEDEIIFKLLEQGLRDDEVVFKIAIERTEKNKHKMLVELVKEVYSYFEIIKSKYESKLYLNKLRYDKLLENRLNIEDVDLMNGVEFEKFISKIFQSMGFSTEITKGSGDQGVDVIAKKGVSVVAIQAKRYSSVVGNHAIMEAVAGMKYYNATKCMVITNNFFTKSAKELADVNNVELWDRDTLIQKMQML